MTTIKTEIDRFTATLAALRADVDAANRRATQAQQVANQATALARGTGDVTADADAARNPESPPVIRVGDAGPTADLIRAVEVLIRERPRLLRELIAETGARIGRVSGAVEKLKLTARVVDLGTGARALWFIPSAEALARLCGK